MAAARDAFAERGYAVPLDEIAARAGVGPGTVYRHFPSKEALFEAVAAERVHGLLARARALADDAGPGDAFFAFLADVAREAAAKRDLPDTISVPGPLADEVSGVLGRLLTAAQGAGTARPDVTAPDVVALLKGLLTSLHGAVDPRQAERLLAVVVAGLRTPSASSDAP